MLSRERVRRKVVNGPSAERELRYLVLLGTRISVLSVEEKIKWCKSTEEGVSRDPMLHPRGCYRDIDIK